MQRSSRGICLVFLDSNIPMYVIGAEHPNRSKAIALLSRLSFSGEKLATDAEVLQEILHRYISINRRQAIQPAFDLVLQIVESVLPIDQGVMERAKTLSQAYPSLSARDAVHLAVMSSAGIDTIFSFDTGFDQVPGVTRLIAS